MHLKSKTFLNVTIICLVMVSSLYASTIRYISGVVTDNRSNLFMVQTLYCKTLSGSTTDSLAFTRLKIWMLVNTQLWLVILGIKPRS